jgi:phage-related protein
VAKTAILAVDIIADATDATKGFDKAAKSASNTADKIDDIGGKSGDTASGLSALAGALDAAGFGPAADALGLMSTGLDATEGSARLFKVAQDSLSLSTIKDTAARIANTVATTAASAATKAWAAVQWLLNSAFLASPLTWIVVGIVALIAVIVLIATKTTWFQDLWAVAWSAIQTAAVAVWDFIVQAATTMWQLIVAGVKLYISIYVGIFNVLKAAIGAVWDWIVDAAKAAWSLIQTGVSALSTGISAVWEGIKSAAGTVWELIKSAAKTALDAILVPINAVKLAFDNVVAAVKLVIDWLGKIKMPDVLGKIADVAGGIWPFAATGGGAPTAPAVSARGMTRATGGGAGTTVQVFVPESSDPVATARYLKALIRRGEAAGVMFGPA